MQITICPVCESSDIRKVRRDWVGTFQNQTYTVPCLEFYECPVCQEKIYDRDAMRKIQAYSPAFVKAKAEVLANPVFARPC